MGEICLQMRPNLIRADLNTCVKFVSQEVLSSQARYHFTTQHVKSCTGTLLREENHNATSLCPALLLSIKILNDRLNMAFLGCSRLTLFYSRFNKRIVPGITKRDAPTLRTETKRGVGELHCTVNATALSRLLPSLRLRYARGDWASHICMYRTWGCSPSVLCLSR